jgi:hypothetical protein
MKINKLSPDIYEIEDFITLEEQKEVLDFSRSLKEEDWWMADSEEYKQGFFYGKQYNGDKPEVFNQINNKVKDLFESLLYVGDVALQRYRKEAKIKAHRDYWLYEEPYHIRFGICIYYNDEYKGGELEYPELGIVHKPKARSLVMHGGNILHSNLPVTSDDQRYFSTCFVRGSKEVPAILNQDLFREVEENDGTTYR